MPLSEAQKASLAKATAARKQKQLDAQGPIYPAQDVETVPVDIPADDPQGQLVEAIVAQISPGRAREEAAAALIRSQGSDHEQAQLERRLHERLLSVADDFDHRQRGEAERQRQAGVAARIGPGGPSGAPNQPIPKGVHRGDVVLLNSPSNVPDHFAIVLRLHPRVDEERWRADLLIAPLHGSPAVAEAVPYGPGVGQFRLLPDDEDDIGTLVPGVYDKPYESPLK